MGRSFRALGTIQVLTKNNNTYIFIILLKQYRYIDLILNLSGGGWTEHPDHDYSNSMKLFYNITILLGWKKLNINKVLNDVIFL